MGEGDELTREDFLSFTPHLVLPFNLVGHRVVQRLQLSRDAIHLARGKGSGLEREAPDNAILRYVVFLVSKVWARGGQPSKSAYGRHRSVLSAKYLTNKSTKTQRTLPFLLAPRCLL